MYPRAYHPRIAASCSQIRCAWLVSTRLCRLWCHCQWSDERITSCQSPDCHRPIRSSPDNIR